MRIRRIRVANYQGYSDTGFIELDAGLNLVVGVNSVGKSSLLRALSLQPTGSPHLSLLSKPHARDPVNGDSRFEIDFELSGDELHREFRRAVEGWFPCPHDMPVDENTVATYMARLFAEQSLTVRVTLVASQAQYPNWETRGDYALQMGPTRNREGRTMYFRVRDRGHRAQFTEGPGFQDKNNEFPKIAAHQLASTVYRFDAERVNLARASSAANEVLLPNAQNLAQVLNTMKQNPARWDRYVSLVRRVFPAIFTIALRPLNSEAEILVWHVDPQSERQDLAIPLDRCGSGVGQVLAMLYVIVTADAPHVLCVDEPNSYLHPGAARALIKIFKEFNQHQYIIATHSPEVISELSNARLLRIVAGEAGAAVLASEANSVSALRESLGDVGARVADILGFERLLWVEGPSDAEAFSEVASVWYPQYAATIAFLPVRSTSEFETAHAQDVLYVYRQLVAIGAPMPPNVGFLFDKEGRSDGEVDDLRRQSDGRMKFTDRRMLENYLLDEVAISVSLVSLGEAAATPAVVRQWIIDHGRDPRYLAKTLVPLGDAWLAKVHAGKLLTDLFSELSEARYTYRKTVHTPELFKWMAMNRPEILEALKSVVTHSLGLSVIS